MGELKIIVQGHTNTGKTTVARIIEEALQTYGFTDVTVKDLDASSDKEPISKRFEATKNRKVTIEVQQLARESKSS